MTEKHHDDHNADEPFTRRDATDMAARNAARIGEVRKAVRRLAIVVISIQILFFALLWVDDYSSCQRVRTARSALDYGAMYFIAQAGRAHLRAQVDPPAIAKLDRQAEVASLAAAKHLKVKQVKCFKFVPDVG